MTDSKLRLTSLRQYKHMTIENLHDLFVHTLQDIYFAEKPIVKKLPKMAEKASSSQLRAAFERHAAETEEHGSRSTREDQTPS